MKKLSRKLQIFLCLLTLATEASSQTLEGQVDFQTSKIEMEAAKGEERFVRRDPSDIILVDGVYHIWYSRRDDNGKVAGQSGYNASIWHATSTDKVNWKEVDNAVTRGEAGEWDEVSAFTPNIIFDKGVYYLYWTGIGDKDLKLANKPTRIGVATSSSPNGPWTKAENNPVFIPSTDATKFDSFRIDDAAMLKKDDKFYLYYKGRGQGLTPGDTKMGVAVSESGSGPWTRLNDGNPVQNAGHEVIVWEGEDGAVYSKVNGKGEKKYKDLYFTILRAEDGVNFKLYAKTERTDPQAGGLFRPELTEAGKGHKATWGIYGVRKLSVWKLDYTNAKVKIQK